MCSQGLPVTNFHFTHVHNVVSRGAGWEGGGGEGAKETHDLR